MNRSTCSKSNNAHKSFILWLIYLYKIIRLKTPLVCASLVCKTRFCRISESRYIHIVEFLLLNNELGVLTLKWPWPCSRLVLVSILAEEFVYSRIVCNFLNKAVVLLKIINRFLIWVFWAEQGAHLWGHLMCLCVSFNWLKLV